MLSSCNCECHENYPNANPPQRTYPNSNSKKNFNIEINNLQSEIEEKMNTSPDYSELESKFLQLENDIQILSEEKLKIEYELRQLNKKNDKIISDLQKENDNLANKINERSLMIEEL